MHRLVAILLVAAGCASPARTSDPSTVRADLLAADRAFAADTYARGLDGWMDHHAPDAVRLAMGGTAADGSVVQGLDAVRAYDAGLFTDPTTRLVWTPTEGGAFADRSTGFTTGRSAMVRLRTDGAAPDTLFRGTYVTIWRRGVDGRWRVILDTGA